MNAYAAEAGSEQAYEPWAIGSGAFTGAIAKIVCPPGGILYLHYREAAFGRTAVTAALLLPQIAPYANRCAEDGVVALVYDI